MMRAISSRKNSVTAVPKSPARTLGKGTRRYRAPKDPIAQLRTLAGPYLRHGGKQSRRKRVARLEKGILFITARFRINDLRQIGKKHIHTWYAELYRNGLSDKTLDEYYAGFCLLWEWLKRLGNPPIFSGRQK